MSRANNQDHQDHQDNKDIILICKKTTSVSKVSAASLKKLHVLMPLVKPLKCIMMVSNGLSKYYKGQLVADAAAEAALELRISIINPAVFTFSVAAAVAKLSGYTSLGEIMQYPITLSARTVLFGVLCLSESGFASDTEVELNCKRLLAFKNSEMSNFRKLIKPAQDFFNKIVGSLAVNYKWNPDLYDRFNTLFIVDPSSHLIHNNITRAFRLHLTNTTVGVSSPLCDTADKNSPVARRSSCILDDFTDDKLKEFSKTLILKTQEINWSAGLTVTESIKTGLVEIVSIMQSAAAWAVILEKPTLSKPLSSIAQGIMSALNGVTKISEAGSALSTVAGVLSACTGVVGIISGAAALFSESNEDAFLKNLGAQLENIGNQLSALLKNQQNAIDYLGMMNRQITIMDQRLMGFMRTTQANFEFLNKQHFVAARSQVFRYLNKTNTIVLRPEELRDALMTLEVWLRDHLPSPVINGAIYGETSAAESISMLTNMMQDEDLFFNNIGFFLKRLQLNGIAISEKFFVLPPALIYADTVQLFIEGLISLRAQSDNCGRSFANEIQQKFSDFKILFEFLEATVLLEFPKLYNLCCRKFITVLSRLSNTISNNLSESDILQEIIENSSSSSLRKEIYDIIDVLEEMRLLFDLTRQLTGGVFPSKYPLFSYSKQKLLRSEFKVISKTVFGDAITFSLGWERASEIERSFFNDPNITNKIFENPLIAGALSNPSLAFIFMLFSNRLYELLILHFAAGSGDVYRAPSAGYRRLFPDTCSNDIFSNVEEEYLLSNSSKKSNTNFLVLMTLFAVDKLAALRCAYQYYAAFVAGNTVTTDRLRPSIDAKMLLWLTAILGRYEIFLSLDVNKLKTLSFVESVGSKTVGSYNYKIANFDQGRYTAELHGPHLATQRLEKKEIYTSPTLPLMVAARCNRQDVVEGMLQAHLHHGKDIGLHRKDADGLTPAEIAYKNKHYALAKLLDEHSQTLSEVERRIVVENVGNRFVTFSSNQSVLFARGSSLAQQLMNVYQGAAAASAAA